MLTISELSALEAIHDILKPLLFLSDTLAGEKEVTVCFCSAPSFEAYQKGIS